MGGTFGDFLRVVLPSSCKVRTFWAERTMYRSQPHRNLSLKVVLCDTGRGRREHCSKTELNQHVMNDIGINTFYSIKQYYEKMSQSH